MLFSGFLHLKITKKCKKCKKIQKNAKKMQKNLHISKKSCTFAPSNEKDTNKKPKINQLKQAKL